MEQWTRVRLKVLTQGQSKRSVMKEEGLHWDTRQRMLRHSSPPGYKRRQPPRPRQTDAHREWIKEVLRADREAPKKQRHTAQRIYERLQAERGYRGGYTMVKEVVRELAGQSREVFVPLAHRPGEGQADFGHALVCVDGKLGAYPFFIMSLPYSDAMLLQAFARACTESFQEGHVRAFDFFGGVPWRLSYDNTKVAVAQIIGGRERKLTDGFLQLQSHYLFEEHFCRVGRANEKGVVEAMVGYGRRNFLVPVPQVKDLEELNACLLECCRRDLDRRVRGQTKTKGELLAEERPFLRPLPAAAFEACRKVSTGVSSLSLARFDGNDYSVPVAYAHQPVVVKGFCREVAVYREAREIARHRRLWAKEQLSFQPVHYLALLERKPGALDHARPLAGWPLPACFAALRRRLEAHLGHAGTREYIRVLRLLEKHPMVRLEAAVHQALACGPAPTCDVVGQYLYPEPDFGLTRFRWDGHPQLRHVQVRQPEVRAYGELLWQGGGA